MVLFWKSPNLPRETINNNLWDKILAVNITTQLVATDAKNESKVTWPSAFHCNTDMKILNKMLLLKTKYISFD